jgi:hypothetical protein
LIPNYEIKMRFLSEVQGGNCAIAADEGKVAPITELHHRLHQTKENRKCFPLFINSVLNLTAVNHNFHMQRPSFGKIYLRTALKIERYLSRKTSVNVWCNNPGYGWDGELIMLYIDSLKKWDIRLKGM